MAIPSRRTNWERRATPSSSISRSNSSPTVCDSAALKPRPSQ